MLDECAGIARQITACGSAFARDAREEQGLYRSDNGIAGGINHRLAGTCRHGLGLPHAVRTRESPAIGRKHCERIEVVGRGGGRSRLLDLQT